MISNLATHAPLAEETLNAFLGTLLGGDLTLELGEPAESLPDDAIPALMDQLAVLGVSGKRMIFAVLLDDQWLGMLSKAMLGEAMAITDDGADDLVRELAAQGYGSVRNAMASDGVKLPEVTYAISLPGEAPQLKAYPEELASVPFSMEVDDGSTLTGKALISLQPPPAQPPAPAPPQKEAAPEPPPKPAPKKQVPVSPASFPDLGNEQILSQLANPNFGLLAEVHLEITVELGRRQLPLADVLNFTSGSVIELEKLVGEPLQVYANGRLIAEGEAVVIDEQFGVRITSLASAKQRAKVFL